MEEFEGYIFDLDGTVYLGDALVPGAGEAVVALRERGKRTVFLSNNPSHTRYEYAAKLTRLGLPTGAEDIVNSSVVMVDSEDQAMYFQLNQDWLTTRRRLHSSQLCRLH